MTGDEFEQARIRAESKSGRAIPPVTWMLALGHRAKLRKTLMWNYRHHASGRRPVAPRVAMLAEMFAQFGVPLSFDPRRPEWKYGEAEAFKRMAE